MSRIVFDAAAGIEVARSPERVWEWVNRLPGALQSVPIIRDVREVVPGERYVLGLGRFGAGRFEVDVSCDMTVERDAPRAVAFDTVPGTGNADVRMCLTLEPRAGVATRIEATIRISPHPDVPRFVPVQPIVAAARASVAFGLAKGLERMKQDLEREP